MGEQTMILETKRLYLRQLVPSDFDALCAILQDETVMYAYEHGFSEAEVQEWLDRQLMRYETDGFGLWAAVLKETGQLIGQCGLTMQNVEDKQVVEVGYLFLQSHWHKGYATEAAAACMEYAFETLNVEEVYSIIRDQNLPSLAVAKRNGMTQKGKLIKYYYGMEMPHLIYSQNSGNF